jgi:hypothetical protein
MDDDGSGSFSYPNAPGPIPRRSDESRSEVAPYTRQYVAPDHVDIGSGFDVMSLFHLFSLPQYHEQLKNIMLQADASLHYSISIK